MKAVPQRERLEEFAEYAKTMPVPWLHEINLNGLSYRWWFWYVCQFYGISTALELGINLARTTAILGTAVADLVIGVEVDPDWGWINRTLGAMPAAHRGKVEIVVGDSIDPETVAEVERILAGRPLELLFIDSTHTAEHAQAELAAYMPMLAPVALVAMDDILVHPCLRDVLYSIPGVHVEMNNLHMFGGLTWGGPVKQQGGFGAAIVNQDGEGSE